MSNKPVAWRKVVGNVTKHYQYNEMGEGTPLYTHPSEHDLGIAEAIGFEKGHKSAEDMLRQQQAEIEALKSELDRAVELYTDKAIENEALKQIIDANNLNQNIGQFVKPTLKIEEVMSENCTCYKLGYSPLNDYASVKQK